MLPSHFVSSLPPVRGAVAALAALATVMTIRALTTAFTSTRCLARPRSRGARGGSVRLSRTCDTRCCDERLQGALEEAWGRAKWRLQRGTPWAMRPCGPREVWGWAGGRAAGRSSGAGGEQTGQDWTAGNGSSCRSVYRSLGGPLLQPLLQSRAVPRRAVPRPIVDFLIALLRRCVPPKSLRLFQTVCPTVRPTVCRPFCPPSILPRCLFLPPGAPRQLSGAIGVLQAAGR